MKKYLKIFLIFTVVLACICSTVSCTEAPEDNGTSESTVSDTPAETDGSSDTTSEATETDEISDTTSEAEETDEREYAMEVPERYRDSEAEKWFYSSILRVPYSEEEQIKKDFTLDDMLSYLEDKTLERWKNLSQNEKEADKQEFYELFGVPHASWGSGMTFYVYITSDGYYVSCPGMTYISRELTNILDESGELLGIDEWLEKH